MQLKRYSNEELQEIFTKIFYDYISKEDVNSEYITPAHQLHSKYEAKVQEYSERAEQYKEKLKEADNTKLADSLKESLANIQTGIDLLKSANMENQKALYERTKAVDFGRTRIRIPLDKKINSYYDDFSIDVLFYDDVCTLNGKFEIYESLETDEDRRNFIKANTEITHFGLVWAPQRAVRALIEVKGRLKYDSTRAQNQGIALLPKKFSDFETLTLKDTGEIPNNDLKQFIQTKIDLDKENMKLLSTQNIRGDVYKIYESPEEKGYYIRYVCRSTGRVYYNRLNLDNLRVSNEFKTNNYDSYARAWWNLNTLGGDVDGEPVIRC